MIRRVGEAVRPDIRYRLRPGVYALLMRNGQVLLTHQANPIPEYQLPGGGIDPGEPVIPALHREVMEETGWRITNLRRLGAFRRFTYMAEYDLWAEKLCHVYTGQPTTCHGPPTEPGHTALWAAPHVAAAIVEDDGNRLFIRKFLL